MAYPNLIAEMNRTGVTVKDIAKVTDRSSDTVKNWLKGKGEFPIGKAFAVQEIFFPSLPLSYLFNAKAIIPQEVKEMQEA